MNRITRRIATIIAVGAFAIPALAACGAAEQAVDCANLSSTITETIGSLAGDPAGLKTQAQKLRDDAADIGDDGLKTSVTTLADSLDRLAVLQEKVAKDPTSLSEKETTEMTNLAGDIPTQASAITGKCSDITS